MNEPILPKEWYGNLVNIDLRLDGGSVEGSQQTLLSANLAGAMFANRRGHTMFIPWSSIVSVSSPDDQEEADNG